MPTIELTQGSIAYREDGEGPPIVLLHGLLVNGRLWRKVVPVLAPNARVVVPELPFGSHTTPMKPGADLTPTGIAALVAELLEKLDLDDVTLVGCDTGGAIAQLVAADHPARIGRLVLTNCDAFDNFPPKLFKGLLAAARIPGALAAFGLAFRFKPLWRTPIGFGLLTKRPIEERVVRSWLAPGQRAEIRRDVAKALRGVDPAQTLRAADALRSFDKPVLLAWADEDRLFPVEHAHRLAALVPDGRVELIPDSYTFTPEDQPEMLGRLVADFVRQPAGVAGGAA